MPDGVIRFGSSGTRFPHLLRVAMVTFLVACGPVAAHQDYKTSIQSTDELLPSFEVASIKPNRSGRADVSTNWGADTCVVKNVTAKRLIAMAYGVMEKDQIAEAPGWTESDRYDINAKIEDSMTEKMRRLPLDQQGEQFRLLVRSLLEDRFQLRVSHATKDLPVFALVVAKNGPKLAPTTLPPDDPANTRMRTPRFLRTPASGQLVARGQAIVALLGMLSREVGGHVVLDETGLKGEFDFKLQWTPETSSPTLATEGSQTSLAASPSETSAPSIFTALQEQLGLKLESRKAPRDVIVVTQIKKPSEN